MDQIFLTPISWFPDTDRKFLIHINFGIWIRSIFAVRGAMDQIFLTPISWVPDTDQKFMIHINFGICGAMDQKFLIPMLGEQWIRSIVVGSFDHLFLCSPRGSKGPL